MSNSDVRPSRDGDQFHYLWAARRCLLLLSQNSGLVAVSIEGASTSENELCKSLDAGEELIDVAEYYGSEAVENATLIRYIQLKHSTKHAGEPWTASGLEKTLRGFANRYKALAQPLEAGTLNGKLEFCFVSNRPISSDFLEAVDDAANGAVARHPQNLKKLEKYTGLSGLPLCNFCRLLRIEGNHDGYWDQRNILAQDKSGYLPDSDVDAPILLKELVTRKALSESAENLTISKVDVLRVLKTHENRLFPAPCLIKDTKNVVPREQEAYLIGQISNADNAPVIVHAASGVGKSVFSTRIKLALSDGSLCIVYDCFGNGQYRSASTYRHRHKDALVQIANELAGRGFCHPLIPTVNADSAAYLRAFLYRLKQSITSLRAEHPDALLCIVVDAADNAQMAAEEIGEPRSFARDLLREKIPQGVRLVMLCRTHRQDLLAPPPHTLRLELQPFSRTETATYLRNAFPGATENDVDEFHRLSSRNPRVQATALSREATLSEILRALGPNPTTVEDTIASLLDNAVADLRDKAGPTEGAQIDLICMGLSALRPLIPIPVLASLSGVDASTVKSFAVDLGRPLIVIGDTIQFFDEPAETWFRERFKPKASQLGVFIEILKPFASHSAYVASALPQLMLEANQFADLVKLALSSEGLPDGSPIEKRDVELQRLQFALKASLRTKRYTDAAKLAIKAGGETAGDERQQKLLQDNTDLASVFMDVDRIQEIVSRRTFGSGWLGSHHVYEAGIMSGRSELSGDARSRLRMAHEWLRNWSRLSDEQRKHERIKDDDIAEMAMAHFNIHGADSCIDYLRGWKSRMVAFRTGRILAKRFVDHGRYDDLDRLTLAAKNDLFLVLAITLELREVQKNPPKSVVKRALRLLLNNRVNLKEGNQWDGKESLLRAVTALVEAGLKVSTYSKSELATLLLRFLPDSPPRVLSSRFSGSQLPFLRACTLQAALSGHILNLIDLAYPDLQKELENKKIGHQNSSDAQEFKNDIGALLPWYQLWARVILGLVPSGKLGSVIADTRSASLKAANTNYKKEFYTENEIARLWFGILLQADVGQSSLIDDFNGWIDSLKQPLYTSTLTQLARMAARQGAMEQQSLDYANRSFVLTKNYRDDAEAKAIAYVELSRAVLVVSKSEAEAYFNEAVEVASKIGDENLDRWTAILDLADHAANPGRPMAETAYKLARCAELTYDYVARDKHFNWEGTVRAIAGLCPVSSITILSRWRDRGFGWAERLLPVAVHFLVARRSIDPKTALSLVGFRAHWDEILLLGSALDVCVSKVDKETVLGFLYRYMRLGERSASEWRNVKEVVVSHDLTLSDIDELIAFGELKERSSQSRSGGYSDSTSVVSSRKDERNWDAMFSGIELSLANDISCAFGRYKDTEAPYNRGRFFEEACKHVSIGKEAEFIRALSDVAELDIYDFRYFLEQFPDAWRPRLAVKPALVDTLKSFCRRYCMEITKNRYYEILPFKKASDLSGISEGEIVDVILSAIGEVTELAGARRLFTLVGLLALRLSDTEALEALSFGLDLFEGMLKESDGDGHWSEILAPPAYTDAAIAGYIWAGLAAPQAILRWEAAHAVRGLSTLDRKDVLAHLINLARAANGGPFVDARLHFYHLHALQWLLIALARAAKDKPASLLPHWDFLIQIALGGQPHILILGFAAKAALALLDSGLVSIGPDVRQRLMAVNTSDFPVELSKHHGRVNSDRTQEGLSPGKKEFYFGIDMGPYWFDKLGDCFAMSEIQIEREAAHVITNEWGYSELDSWEKDERTRRRLFRDGEAYHSHGSYPRADDLRFYLSYHAMMVVAGKLLATVPLHQDPDYSEDEFASWLSSHDLTRKDGYWLVDRRDPVPFDWPGWKAEQQEKDWRWSVTREDFERILGLPGDRLNLWGHWTMISGSLEESVQIASALVSSERSVALLRALQTASDPHSYRIPDAIDDFQIDSGKFLLKGWLVDRDKDYGRDQVDPWAGDIQYPPIIPAQFVRDLMKLDCDPENRVWRRQDDRAGENVLWSQIWGCHRDKDDETEGESGRRLQSSFPFITGFLKAMNMDLIVKIATRREIRRSRYDILKEEDFGYFPSSARLFVINADGRINAI